MIVREIEMNQEQLYKAAMEGDRIEAPAVVAYSGHGLPHQRVPAVLQRISDEKGDLFWMWGPSGRHSLNVANTDAARLHSHWQGFKEIASAKVRKEGV